MNTTSATTTTDHIYQSFLEDQSAAGMALSAESDLIDLALVGPERFLVRFHCRSLAMSVSGEVHEVEQVVVGIQFPPDYLRQARPETTLTILDPINLFHSNIRGPYICIGQLNPGTLLVDLIYQVFEILTWVKWSAHDGLNEHACEWARNHRDRFPVDSRPLKRRQREFKIEAIDGEETES